MAQVSGVDENAKSLTIKVIPESEMEGLRATADEKLSEERADIIHSQVTVLLKFSETKTLRTGLTVVIDKRQRILYITARQLDSFSDRKITEIICQRFPTLPNIIKQHAKVGVELPFLRDHKEPIMVPLNRAAAAGIILAFFNDNKDPLDRIRDLFQDRSDRTEAAVGRVLITYFLSCIKYIMDIDFVNYICEDKGMVVLTDDTAAIPISYRTSYQTMKKEQRKISQNTLAFQAVFGAYSMCRPVANKRDFRTWITKRHAAFMASIQQTAELNTYIDYQRGGIIVNEAVVSRTPLRRLIYEIITSSCDEIVATAVKVHVRMLTALSEMTTYSLIQQVVSKGGCAVTLAPLPDQLRTYDAERKEVLAKLDAGGYPADHIQYLHLVLPTTQAFTASKYADLVVTAQMIEEVESPKDTSLEQYKAKISGAVINKTLLKQFLSLQAQDRGLVVDEAASSDLVGIFGNRTPELFNEAKRILNLIKTQRGMALQPLSSR